MMRISGLNYLQETELEATLCFHEGISFLSHGSEEVRDARAAGERGL